MATPAQTTPSTTAPTKGNAQGAFPPFQTETYASQLLWLALCFAFLYVFMAKVVVPRVGGIIMHRAARIASDLDEASSMKARAEAAGAAYEKALGDARAKAQSLAQETNDKASAASHGRRKALEADLAAKVAKAEFEIAAMKAKAMGNVSGIASDAAAAIVERLTGIAPAKAAVTSAVNTVMEG